jgi:hypothetical protein
MQMSVRQASRDAHGVAQTAGEKKSAALRRRASALTRARRRAAGG